MFGFQSTHLLMAGITRNSAVVINSFKKSPFLRSVLKVVIALPIIFFATFLLALFHEVLMVSVAEVLRWSVKSKIIDWPLEHLIVSSVHRSTIIAGLDVYPGGIAVAGSFGGELLHRALPSFFLDPAEVAPGAWVSAVFNEEHAPIFGIFVAQATVDIILLTLGSLITTLGLRAGSLETLWSGRHRNTWLVVSGLFILAQSIWATWNILKFVSLRDVGVGLFITQVLGINSAQGYTFMMEEFMPWAVPPGIIAVGLGVLPFFEMIGQLAKRLCLRISRVSGAVRTVRPNSIIAHSPILLGLLVMLLLSVFFPASSLGRQSYRDPKMPRSSMPESMAPTPMHLPSAPIAADVPSPQATAASSPRISDVTTTATPYPILASSPSAEIQPLIGSPKRAEIRYSPAGPGFVLTFNGMRRKLRAVNYNVNYTRESDAEQIEHYRQDFDIIKKTGFSAVTGYGIFNEVMLRVAEEKGIYVVMPFELDPTADYLSDDYRTQMTQKFVAFLHRIKNYSSVMMINVGGDELATQMEIKHPAPLEGRDRYKQIQMAVNYEFELAELAYKTTSLPTLLKEHGEFFLPYTEAATLRARAEGKEPERYIIVGIDIYGRPAAVADRLEKIIIPWVAGRLRLPMMVSEFGPYGGLLRDRPEDYKKILLSLRTMVANYQIVGYAVYVFFMDETHPENRLVNDFGLLDSKRQPVDGSLPGIADALDSTIRTEKDLEIRKRPFFEIYPTFRQVVESLGGYPASGIIERYSGTDRQVEQYFVHGYKDGRAIAYKLFQRGNANIEIREVRQVVYNLLGDYSLEGTMLEAYIANGGYARFGAPISNAYSSAWDNKQGTRRQDFAKGYAIFIEDGSTIPTPRSFPNFGRKD